MSENVEDLYLKGFMSFSSKDYKAAKAFWEKVLSIEPGHEKALQGLADINAATEGAAAAGEPKKKKTSKEILAEIKKLYSRKNYADALRLCEVLVRKHPNNADIKGLYAKIEKRLQAQDATISATSLPGEATKIVAERAESSVSEENQQAQVEKLIQEGVSLYEIQDYENAISVWEKVLAIDPENRIASDYINNVKPLVDGQDQPAPAVEAAPQKPGKEDLIRIYNEALALYKENKFAEAIDRWNEILRHHPNHKETQQCIEKAQAALAQSGETPAPAAQDDPNLEQLEIAREELSMGRHIEAERIVMRLSIEAPNLEGLDELREAIEERQRQISEIRSLDIETTEEDPVDTTATEDEITRYFTPETSDGSAEARQVSRVVRPVKQSKPKNKLLLVGLPILLILLVVGGYFGYDYYQTQQMAKTDEPTFRLAREVAWDSVQQRAEDFLAMGNDFRDESDYLYSVLAYQRVDELTDARLSELNKLPAATLSVDDNEERTRLVEIVSEARQNLDQSLKQVDVSTELSGNEMDLAEADFKRERWAEGSERLVAILRRDQDDERVRQRLGEALLNQALVKMNEKATDEALALFRRAASVSPAYEMPRKHAEVIQRFYHGKINLEEKDQWFLFFLD